MSTHTHTHTRIPSHDIKPGDIIRFEYGDYDNWVTVRIDKTRISNPNSHTHFPLELVWHYLSDEPKEASEEEESNSKPPKDCRAEKLGNNPSAQAPTQAPYKQFTCYSSLDSIVEKLN